MQTISGQRTGLISAVYLWRERDGTPPNMSSQNPIHESSSSPCLTSISPPASRLSSQPLKGSQNSTLVSSMEWLMSTCALSTKHLSVKGLSPPPDTPQTSSCLSESRWRLSISRSIGSREESPCSLSWIHKELDRRGGDVCGRSGCIVVWLVHTSNYSYLFMTLFSHWSQAAPTPQTLDTTYREREIQSPH
jgi:hypothetical protein